MFATALAAAACSDKGSGASGASTTPPPALSGSATAKVPTCDIDDAQYADWDDFGKGCGFAVPKSVATLPPRLAWEACGPAVGLNGCKKLKIRQGATVRDVRGGTKRPDVVELGFVEHCKTDASRHALLVIAEADGPTLAAFASRQHDPGKCDVEMVSVHQGAYTARLTETADSGPGAFVGAPTQTSKPSVLRSWEPGKADKGAVASDARWLVFGPSGAKTARWGDPDPETVTDNALNVEPTLHHGDVLWADPELTLFKAGKTDKLREPVDGDAASSLGVDGTSMAFTLKRPGDPPTYSLAAGPYSTDRDKLSLKAILSLPKPPDASPWTVGCGYAAHGMSQNEVLIVRLKDGASWTASSKGCDSAGLCLTRPLAVTCTEVMFAAASKSGTEESIVRTSFAGLGKPKDAPSAPTPLASPTASASASASASAAPSTDPSSAPAPSGTPSATPTVTPTAAPKP